MQSTHDTLIVRRHVLYLSGYDPQGAEGYHGLFGRTFRRFQKNWPLKATIGELHVDSPELAHWTIDAAGPNWRTETRYEIVRQEPMIRANLAQPLWRQASRALYWALNYLLTGTLYRIYRASPQYGLAVSYFQLLMLLWLAAAALGGWAVGWLVLQLTHGPLAFAVIVGLVVAPVFFKLLRPLTDKLLVMQINNHWPHLLEYGRGAPSCFDDCIEAGARRLVEIARANDADEIAVIGHSGGGVLAPSVVARALELDPQLGRRGPRVVMLTTGSLMPGIGLHRSASRVHRDVARLAVEPDVRWIDVQARADVLNFYDFDPVGGLGIDAGAKRCNPLIWKARVRDMIAQKTYDKYRWDLFRMHFQFIMANDMRGPYEYLMLVCGPVPLEQWARQPHDTLARFGEDASYRAA